MLACVLPYFGVAEVLRVADLEPPSCRAGEVVVAVEAAGVNLIDCARRAGYGAPLFRLKGAREFPMVLGTDFSGIAVSVGRGVRHIKEGDLVWGAKGHGRWGTYSEQVSVPAKEIGVRPQSLGPSQAAAVPYAGLTAWKALVKDMQLNSRNCRGKRILVHAGAGAVGSIAIQLLKHWGARVYTTCSAANVQHCYSLGAEQVIDYEHEDFSRVLQDMDGVLDTVGGDVEERSLSTLAVGRDAAFATLLHPTLELISGHGVPSGLIRALWRKRQIKARQAKLGRRYAWVLHSADLDLLDALRDAVEQGVLKPTIGTVFQGLQAVAEAHRRCESRHGRGKLVVEIANHQ
jgi:NADPH:quinone reductase-like Zn-dependent oxidoreductase